MNLDTFSPERISKTASITLNADIGKVFPLFGPLEEKKWAKGWDPVIVYPPSGRIEEGMVFLTPAGNDHERTYAWVVSQYRPDDYFVEYIVSTGNRCLVIAIRCESISATATKATVTYTYTGLNALGNQINRDALAAMFRRNLEDWEDEINYYLATGEMLT